MRRDSCHMSATGGLLSGKAHAAAAVWPKRGSRMGSGCWERLIAAIWLGMATAAAAAAAKCPRCLSGELVLDQRCLNC